MPLSALTTWSCMHWRMLLGLCPGSSPLHRWLCEQRLLAHSWGQLRDLCQVLCTPALGSLCPWQLPLCHCLSWMMCPPVYLLSQAMTLGPLLFLCFQRHAPTLLHLEQLTQWVWGLWWPMHWWEETWFSLDPPGRAVLPWEEWGSPRGVWPYHCYLAASLYTFQCMAEMISPSTTSQAASSLSSLSPERVASQADWDRNSPVCLGWRDSWLTLCWLKVDQVTARTSGQQHKKAFNYLTPELYRWEFQTVLKIFHGISWLESLSKGKICVYCWLAPWVDDLTI